MQSSHFQPDPWMANQPGVPSDIPPLDPRPTHKPEPIGPTPTPEPAPEPIRDPEPGSPQPGDTPPPIIDPGVPTAPQPIVT